MCWPEKQSLELLGGHTLIQPQGKQGRHIKRLGVPGVGVNGSKGGGDSGGAGTSVFQESLGSLWGGGGVTGLWCPGKGEAAVRGGGGEQEGTEV